MIQKNPRWSSWLYKSPRPRIPFLSPMCSSLALALSAIINCICTLFLPQTWCGMQGIQKIILACKVFNRSSWGHHDVVKCVEILSSVVIAGVNGCCYKFKMVFQKRGMTEVAGTDPYDQKNWNHVSRLTYSLVHSEADAASEQSRILCLVMHTLLGQL